MENLYKIPQEHTVYLRDVCKTFRTYHFFSIDEETGRRRFVKRKEACAADHITFGIRPGEIMGLLGPNGAGKTTTVKMISGLVLPDRGEVYVDGMNVVKHRKEILSRIGVVLEGTRTSMWPLTPLENLYYYGNLRNVRGKVLKERANQLLDFIGLSEKKDVEVRRLSRGQKQKLAICIALIADPKILLLDEPTTGLDVQSSRSIKDKILELTKEHNRSVLVTTHDMNVAQELCDRIGIINKGKLIACKPTAELLELFSKQIFEVRVDRTPDSSFFDLLPASIRLLEIEQSYEGPVLVLQFPESYEDRSESFYSFIEKCRSHNLQIRSITQKQVNLEYVFLQLTGEKPIQDLANQENGGNVANEGLMK
ncbi:MAG: ABC transporter ATP-binding protein [Candidatus Hydrogenedentes bacterium]|nr:ABC transporter ATP-binding protein [Candidatus Hydrogenedentota bacterium]